MVPGIPDSEFIRGKVPMTKEEIRVISISKLRLCPDSVVYDIGAGTGSVSVEIALLGNNIKVYSVERNSDAIDLLKANIDKFKIENINIVEAYAPDGLDLLPAPTHVFIGGSGGKLEEIIEFLMTHKSEKLLRVVVNAVSLETLEKLMKISRFENVSNFEIINVAVTRTKEVAGYHMASGENPVYVCSFDIM